MADMDAIFDRVRRLVVGQLDINEAEISLGARFIDDLGADSLDIIELIMAIEEEFEIEIPDEHAERIASAGDVIAYVKEHA